MIDGIDVLIVGSGGAGLSAALSAHKRNKKVAIVSKTFPTHSQTCQAQGGINAAINAKQSSINAHIEDTFKGGRQLSNKETIKLMCQKAPQTIQWLDQLGVPFSRDSNNNIAQRKFGAASEIRTCYSSDYTGLKILHTLYDSCLKENISFLNEYFLLDIITQDMQAIGITLLNITNGEVQDIYAKSIIIATGGYSNIYYKYTTNSRATTGDGIAAALRAGCILSNMEMVQFHPTAMAGNNILISESARGEGGYLIDSNHQRFIDELKPRDEVARAIYKKIESGDKVYLDLRHIDKDKLLEFMPQEYRLAKEHYSIELDKEILEINPAAHYCMGGIKTNVSCETNIKNLFACGESAQNGIHGANRLGGNSLQEIITFGKIAGESAAQNVEENSLSVKKNSQQKKKQIEYIDALFQENSYTNIYLDKNNLGKKMFENIGLFRDEQSMQNTLNMVKKLKKNTQNFSLEDKSKVYNRNLLDFLEYKNLLELSESVILSALQRKESRGAHYRSDFPKEEAAYEKYSHCIKTAQELQLSMESIS